MHTVVTVAHLHTGITTVVFVPCVHTDVQVCEVAHECPSVHAGTIKLHCDVCASAHRHQVPIAANFLCDAN